jgi:hypothetical protein
MLYTGRALGRLGTQDMTSDVLEIYVARPYISLMKYLFQVSTTLPHRKLQVVPRDFKFNHPAIYGKILNKQNDYLENHRNIAIVAVPLAAMEHCITDHHGKTWKTLKEAILAVRVPPLPCDIASVLFPQPKREFETGADALQGVVIVLIGISSYKYRWLLHATSEPSVFYFDSMIPI